MGALLAKFRKEKTTEQKLEQLEEKIKEIEKYAFNTQEKKKRFVGTFLAVSIGVYVIAFIFIYFVYLPETWKERWLYLVPLLIIPFIIVLLRRLFTWYFQRKLNKNSDKLTKLRAEKKNILEQVMDKETYKVAVNLLTRFGDRSTSSNRLSFGLTQRPSATPVTNTQTATRTLANRSITQMGPITPQPGSLLASRNTPVRPSEQQQQQLVATSQNLALTSQERSGQQLRRRTPFPIVNQAEKNIFERCLDLLIGDGPQDRFAVICRECLSHNGMALKEEFDYIAYRCAFCNALNPARKTRPVAPRLALQVSLANSSKNSDSGNSANNTPTDLSEDDEPEPFERRNQLRLTESTANRSESDSSSDDVIIKREESAVGTTIVEAAAAASEAKLIETPSAVDNEPEPMDISSSDNQKPSDCIEETHESQNTEVDDALKKTN